MLLEKPDDFAELLESSDSQFFSITIIHSDLTASKKLLQPLEKRHVPFVLHHTELGKNLPADFHTRLPIDANEEATFSIDKSDNPVGTQSFLLIVCTGWIVTRIEYHRILQIFQHIARCTSYHY